MKKIARGFLIICMCLLSACTTHVEYGFVNKDVAEIISRSTNMETFLVMIYNDDSYACDIFVKEYESVLVENNITVYLVDEQEIEQSQKDQIEIALGTYTSWPALFYVKDGSVGENAKFEYSLDPEGWMTWMESLKLL